MLVRKSASKLQGRHSPQAMRHGGCAMERWLLDPAKAKESEMLARAARLTLADAGACSSALRTRK